MSADRGAYVMRLAHTDGAVGRVAHIIITTYGGPPGRGRAWRTACGAMWADGARTGPTGWRFFTPTTEPTCKRCLPAQMTDERCACLNPAGLRCTWNATEADRLCDPCRIGKPVMGDGKHWCRSSSTVAKTDSGAST